MSQEVTVRVRFAPTPSGKVHIEKLRAALINWLFAKKFNGTTVLRIDDLDPSEVQDGGFESLVEELHWLGLDSDEGANKSGGPYGPYFQSERKDIYKPFIDKMIIEKSAYRCFCVPHINTVTVYSPDFSHCQANCRNLSDQTIKHILQENHPYVIRLRAPAGEIIVKDIIQGRVVFKGEALGDFIFAGSEDFITPEFASAIDDCLMMISHVIRGENFMSRTPRQIMICRALDLEPPVFGHLTPIADTDGVPLRSDSEFATIEWLRREGFFPEPVLGFVARLAGMVLSSSQRTSLENLIANFDISQILIPEAVFDFEILKEENAKEIQRMEVSELIACAIPFLLKVGFSENDSRIPTIVELYKDNVQYLSELARKASIFIKNNIPLSDKTSSLFIRKDSSQKVLWSFKRELESVRDLNANSFRKIMTFVKQETGILGYDLWTPIRIAITGEISGPDLPVIAELLGREKCLRLIKTILG